MTINQLAEKLKNYIQPAAPYNPDLKNKYVIGTNNYNRHVRQRENLSKKGIDYNWASRKGIYYLIIKKP